MDYDDISGGSAGFMKITSTDIPEQVAAVQLEINYDPNSVKLGKPSLAAELEAHNQRISLSYKDNGDGKLRVVFYHGSPLYYPDELIQIGSAELLEIPVEAIEDVKSGDKSKLRFTEALFATASAQRVMVSGVDDPILPYRFELSQNYPNPFNPTTTIEFSIHPPASGGAPSPVRLDIFNVLGQQVRTLVDDVLPAGTHQVVWDATNDNGGRVATGIYLYRLRIGSESETKKMLFLK
jgi:hypothetical protein